MSELHCYNHFGYVHKMDSSFSGEFKGIVDCFIYTAKTGPAGFFKGFVPAFVRLAPHTVLMFVFFEQIRQRFGYLPPESDTDGPAQK